MKILLLLGIAAIPAFAQCGSIAMNPITGKLDCVGNSGTISVSTLSDGATVQTSTRPTFQAATCNATIGLNALVQISGVYVVNAAGTIGILGTARAACTAGIATTVAVLGVAPCIAEGAITVDHITITGTIDPTRCKDSGTTSADDIPKTTPVVGVARESASNGATFSVSLGGPHHFGTQPASSTLPDVVSVTSGVTTTIDIPLNTTLTNASQAYPVCATSSRVFFEPGGSSMNAGLTIMTVTFSPNAPASGSCTANLTGGSGVGGGGGGGGTTYEAGIGLELVGNIFRINSATGRYFLTNSASLTFGSIAAQGCNTQTITVTGALTGEAVQLHLPVSSDVGIYFEARVTAADTVTVRGCNWKTSGAVTPTAGTTYSATVTKGP